MPHAWPPPLACLPRPPRPGRAALGLLGRPAAPALLGTGLPDLVDAGLAQVDDERAAPVSPYVAEVAAGLLDPAERKALHRRLADLVPARESARHLAAAGEPGLAYERALSAATQADSLGERAELLALACELPGTTPDLDIRLTTGTAALAVGWPQTCLRALGDEDSPEAAVLRGEALLQMGDAGGAVEAVAKVPDDVAEHTRAARDRLRLLGLLAQDPPAARGSAEELATRGVPAHPGLRAALAAVHAAGRTPGWEGGLAAAAQFAGESGDPLAARWSAWLLVETLAADGRLAEAAQAAAAAAAACVADLAYSWQTRFLAARLWCLALRGDVIDEVVSRAAELTDRTLPSLARGYASAAASLAEADGGLGRRGPRPTRSTSTGPPGPGTPWPGGRRCGACWRAGCPRRTRPWRYRRCCAPRRWPSRPDWWCCSGAPGGRCAGTRSAATSAVPAPATTSPSANARCSGWSHGVNRRGASLDSWASRP